MNRAFRNDEGPPDGDIPVAKDRSFVVLKNVSSQRRFIGEAAKAEMATTGTGSINSPRSVPNMSCAL